ncbi:periplasmic binding protein-like II [Piromyces finnis]|uniref:Periplasmic binding protein-like II n=1 Tax=Piromyces finnis TaxID=1754191 RepID=A0A1Y1UXE3_9FUNG|nr:periplasmic binding protein-like II [Piromyces finnis]|eukprot:ORX42915.1 periplasmic binding protein-like II [Piromyces finnis]
MVLFSSQNITSGENDYLSTIDALLNKKTTLYDLYVYDPAYTKIFSKHFINLKEKLSEEYIQLFSRDSYESSIYEDQLVSLPIYMKYKVMYSNIYYLNKYKKNIPETWDELIKISKFIINEEKKENNTNLVGYNGLFPNNENVYCSIYEFIYSFRETKDSPFPGYDSQAAVNALIKLKEIKDSISNDETFASDEVYNVNLMFSGNILFSNFWDAVIPPNYEITPLPGKNKGVNGSCTGGFNIGISKYISKEKQIAALKVLKFFTSKEEQKKLTTTYNVISAMTSIYDDEELCKSVNCKLIKNIQGAVRPCSSIDNYEEYKLKVIELVNDYLFNNKPAKDILTKIDNITKIYNFSIKTLNVSLVMFILLSITFFTILFSSIILFIPRFKRFFQFMSLNLEIVYIIGSLLILISGYTYFGVLKPIKCFYQKAFLILGITMIFTPILYKLIINFPEKNKVSEIIKSRKYTFILTFVIIEIILNSITLLSPYEITKIEVEDGKNFLKCKYSILALTLSIIQYIAIFIIFVIINVLIFLEWNIIETYHDLRTLTIFIGMDWILLLIFIIFSILKIKNFLVVNIARIIIIIMFSASNHFYMFVIRIFLSKVNGNSMEEEKIIDKLLYFNNQSNKTSNIVSSTTIENTNTLSELKTNSSIEKERRLASSSKIQYSNKLLSYHFSTNIHSDS